MTVKHAVVAHRAVWLAACVALFTAVALVGMTPTIVPGAVVYVALGLVGLLIVCPGCGCRVVLQADTWRRIAPLDNCPRCGADWSSTVTQTPRHGLRSDRTSIRARSETAVSRRHPPAGRHPRRISTRTLLFADLLFVPVLVVGLFAIAPYSAFVDRNAGLIFMAAVIISSSMSYFVRCRRCGEYAWRRPSGWYGGWPPKRCSRCGEQFSKDG